MDKKAEGKAQAQTQPICFVLMPISDPKGYDMGHFQHVFDDILEPACNKAGFQALRADQVKQCNVIHLDILRRLLEAPMALCDLSSHNPNVLFELALRQAFDKPVALVQEVGTPDIFDITPIRHTDYRKGLLFREVPEDRDEIAAAIKETYDAYNRGDSENSIVKLLSLGKAFLPEITPREASADIQQLILMEIGRLREEMQFKFKDASFVHGNIGSQTLNSSMLGEMERMLPQVERMILEASESADLQAAALLIDRCNQFLRVLLSHGYAKTPQSQDLVDDYERCITMLQQQLAVASCMISQKQKK